MNLSFASVVRPTLWFGPYPTQTHVEQLEAAGVRAFINVTRPDEMLDPYVSLHPIINIPIEDNSVPDDVPTFCQQISEVSRLLRQGTHLYVHCKGGHGRSGMVAAILLVLVDGCSPSDAIAAVTEAHRTRPALREFWRKRPCPHLHAQRKFVYRIFSPLYWAPHTPIAANKGLCPDSPHPVSLAHGTFHTSSSAIRALSSLGLDTYSAARAALHAKFTQHPSLLKSLLWTGFREFKCRCVVIGSVQRPPECTDQCCHALLNCALNNVKRALLDSS